MAVRNNFAAGEVLAAQDLNDTFAAKAPLAAPNFTTDIDLTGSGPQLNLFDSDLAGARAELRGHDGRLQFFADVSNAVVDTQIQFSIDGTERMVIDSNGLISGSGTTLGAWTTYTPTTNCTVGNGTITGKYMRIGKTVSFRASFVLGSTSVIASDASLSGPFTAADANNYVGAAYYVDQSLSAFYSGFTKGSFLGYQNTFGFVSATAPFTWATSDSIFVSATYQIA